MTICIVTTTPSNTETQEIAKSENLEIHLIVSFYGNGASFNRGKAINEVCCEEREKS